MEQGKGEPILFVHGSLCDYRYWFDQISGLSDDFRCVSVSLSHYWPADEACIQAEFSWRAHVAELGEFVAAMNFGPVHLVGHSRGGCVAFHVAREYPRLVKSLVLADPGGPLLLDHTMAHRSPPSVNALHSRVVDLISRHQVEPGLELFVDSVSEHGSWKRSPALFRRMATDNAGTLAKQFHDPLPAYSLETARDVKCKTLLIGGERSPRVYQNNVNKLTKWIGSVEQSTIRGASHGMNISHPGRFNRIVRALVES